MKALLVLLALLPACVAQVEEDTIAPPEHVVSCALDDGGTFGGYVACGSEVTRDDGEHGCGSCLAGVACTAYYTMSKGVCK